MPLPEVTYHDLRQALDEIGVQRGDVIYVASFLSILGNRAGLADDVIDAFAETVGAQGTIIMPTFNFDFCHGAAFDKDKTESQTGVLSEVFRKRPGVTRMIHPPYHSVAAWGKLAAEIAAIRSDSSFGRDSVYHWMYKQNVKHILLGCTYEQGIPHLHWLEELYEVPYRYWKQFRGQVSEGGQTEERTYYMFARRLDIGAEWGDVDRFGQEFEHAGFVKMANIGLGKIKAFNLEDFYNYFAPRLQEDRLLFLKEEIKPFYYNKYSPVKRLHHVGLTVSTGVDLSNMMCDLGFNLSKESQVPSRGMYSRRFAASNVEIELVEPVLADGTSAGGTIDHLAFEVDDLEEAVAFFERKGYKTAGSKVHDSSARCERGCFLSSEICSGVLIELVETSKRHL